MAAEVKKEIEFQIGHVLFIDIVGYSKLLISEQSEQLETLKRIVRDTEQFRLAEAEGKLLRLPTGDGGALVFRTSPEAPVKCALEISKELKKHPELRVRMGIHSGPVNEISDLNEQANIAGAGINIAQRVMDCGDAGHILLSRHVAEDLEHYPRWRAYLHDLGECEVKHGVPIGIVNLYRDGIGNPEVPNKFRVLRQRHARARWTAIATALLLLAGIIAAFVIVSNKSLRSTTIVPGKSIGVLPFVDLSQAKDQEYFCDGISEEILDALARIEGLRVVARTSSFSFKGKNADVREIAQKLNVQNVLEGSLRREGNRIRITAQLVSAADGSHLWSETYERELQGVFAVQDDITRSIVDALKIKLAVVPPARAQQNTGAYDLYLQGLYLSNKSDEESLRESLSLFQRALDIDPNFARAWTGIAKSWDQLADQYVKPLEAYPAVQAAATKAIALDAREADAYCYLGDAERVLSWDYAKEEARLNQALAIDPNSAVAHLFLGELHAAKGDMAPAIEHAQLAKRADPLSPNIANFAGLVYFFAGHMDEAIAEGQRTLDLDPNYVYYESALAAAYRAQGRYQQSAAVLEKQRDLTHEPIPSLAITYALMGRMAEAHVILDQLLESARTKYFAADSIAAIYLTFGETDKAFRWLDRALEEHSGSLAALAIRPEFRPLHSDSRFADLLRRTGIDPVKALNRQKDPVSRNNF